MCGVERKRRTLGSKRHETGLPLATRHILVRCVLLEKIYNCTLFTKGRDTVDIRKKVIFVKYQTNYLIVTVYFLQHNLPEEYFASIDIKYEAVRPVFPSVL